MGKATTRIAVPMMPLTMPNTRATKRYVTTRAKSLSAKGTIVTPVTMRVVSHRAIALVMRETMNRAMRQLWQQGGSAGSACHRRVGAQAARRLAEREPECGRHRRGEPVLNGEHGGSQLVDRCGVRVE